MDRLEAIFGINNPHERAMRDTGRRLPRVAPGVSTELLVDYVLDHAFACGDRMIAAALNKPDVDDDWPVDLGLPILSLGEMFVRQWDEGAKAISERLDQIAPLGLPPPRE